MLKKKWSILYHTAEIRMYPWKYVVMTSAMFRAYVLQSKFPED